MILVFIKIAHMLIASISHFRGLINKNFSSFVSDPLEFKCVIHSHVNIQIKVMLECKITILIKEEYNLEVIVIVDCLDNYIDIYLL